MKRLSLVFLGLLLVALIIFVSTRGSTPPTVSIAESASLSAQPHAPTAAESAAEPNSEMSADEANGFDIVIVAGQSNAMGVGLGPYRDELMRPEIDARIKQLGRFGAGDKKPIQASDRLEHWTAGGGSKGIGFGMAFARRYAERFLAPNRTVLVVPAAFPGTGSYQWDDRIDDWSDPEGSRDGTMLLDDLLSRTGVALSLPGKNKIVAMLWHQGESDVFCLESTNWCHKLTPDENSFKQRIARIFSIVRANSPGQFPIIVGKFVPEWNGAWGEKSGRELTSALARKARIENALASLGDLVPLVACVESAGLRSNREDGHSRKDSIHFTAQSQIHLGVRYFEAFGRLQSQ